MIGHFGLGFYSAFMVADEVQIDTLSYKEGASAVHWASQGGTEYEMQEGNKETVGTEITLFLNEDSLAFANEYRAREVIENIVLLCLLKSSFPKQMRSRSMKRSMRRMCLTQTKS